MTILTDSDQKPQVGSQPQAGAAQPESQQLCFLPNNFDNRPGRLMPQPLSQQEGAASQPQAGAATSQPQAGSGQHDGASQQLLWRFANNFDNKPGFLQRGAESQHDGATSQPQAGAAAAQPQAGASQPQAGSAAHESQPLLHNFPNKPADAFAEVKAAKARASITGVITRRIVVGSKGLGINM